MKPVRAVAAVLSLSLAMGCASKVVGPSTNLNAPNAAIRAGWEVGAADHPRAALHLQYAQEELRRSRAFAANGDADEASLMARRSTADANLAIAITRSEDAKRQAAAAQDQLRELSKPPTTAP